MWKCKFNIYYWDNNKYNHTIPINGNYNVVNKYGVITKLLNTKALVRRERHKTIVYKQTKSKIHNWKTVMALTWYRLFQWKKWVELFFSVPNLLLPLFYKVSVVTMKSSIPFFFKWVRFEKCSYFTKKFGKKYVTIATMIICV